MKAIRFRVLAVAALLSIVTTGCGIYNATPVTIPTIREKGEWQLEGGIVPYGIPTFLFLPRASAAYGLTDHVALAASIDPVRSWTQVMGGVYFPVKDKFVWEVYGGFGTGRGTDGGVVSKSEDYGTYKMAFVQGDCGWRNLTNFLHIDVAMSLKTGLAFYHMYYYSYDDAYREKEGVNFVINPMLEVRFGSEKIKFNVKVGIPYLIPDASGFKLDAPGDGDIGVGVSFFL